VSLSLSLFSVCLFCVMCFFLSYMVERAMLNTLEEGRGLWEEVEEDGRGGRGEALSLFLSVSWWCVLP
jgi:hypothetical protein